MYRHVYDFGMESLKHQNHFDDIMIKKKKQTIKSVRIYVYMDVIVCCNQSDFSVLHVLHEQTLPLDRYAFRYVH